MRARLAFGTSMAFDFDYYLIDEVMAVGDASFKSKSREVFQERLQHSKLIIVSHNMKMVRRMCDIVIYLEGGRVTLYENVVDGIAAYYATADAVRRRDADDDDEEEASEAVGAGPRQ